jgi:heavy metal efflux system protein
MVKKLIQFALDHCLLVGLTAVGLCVLGVLSLQRLSIDAFPDISPNLVQVFAEVEGMAPEEVEQFVTRPIEVAMRGTPGVNKIRSISSLGLSTVNIFFDEDVDIYLARQLISERVKDAEEAMGHGISIPHGIQMGAIASGMGHILAYYIEGDNHHISDLRTLQDWVVKRDIQTVSGVAKVISQGGHVRQYQIHVDPNRLLQYGLSIADVGRAIEENNTNVGAGILERGSEEIIIRTRGLLRSAEDIKATVITTQKGVPVYVGDVATVSFGDAFRRGVALLNGKKELVVGSVYKTHGANSFEVIQRLHQRLEQINASLPAGVRVVTFYDQSALVKNSISTVRGALSLGLILVCIVSVVFLGNIRSSIIVVCSLPFASLFAFILMKQNNIPGDLISFGGVAIALGMIVDATIIMVEKIQVAFVARQSSDRSSETILSAACEVGQPIVFAVIIIIIVFLPIFTLGNVEGRMFRPLAFAVSMTMLGSLVYALLVAPVFYYVMRKRTEGPAVGMGSEQEKKMYVVYQRILHFFLDRRRLVTAIMIVLLCIGVGAFVSLGKEFVPTLQEGTIQCLAYMNPNISLKEINRIASAMAREMEAFDEVTEVVVDIGYGEVGPHMHHTNYACMTVNLKPRDEWQNYSSQDQLVKDLDAAISCYPGVSVSFSQPIKHEVDGLVGGSGSAVVAKIFGPDIDVLLTKAAHVHDILSHIDGVADLRTEQVDGQTQLQVIMKRREVARHGLTTHEVQHTIHDAMAGEEVGRIFENEKSFGVTIRLAEEFRNEESDIANLLIPTPAGYTVPVAQLAKIKNVTGLRQISREATQRFIAVQCNVRGRDPGSFVEEAQAAIREYDDRAATTDTRIESAGYKVAWGGQFELHQAANKRLMIVVPITLFLVLIMLYTLFNSLRDVLLIMLNIPLALVGGVCSLMLFGENLSIPSSIGFIALFGIALTDGLVLISRFEVLRMRGVPLRDAVISGCCAKLRPVIMTTITTALGLLPLVITQGTGSEIQRPLAIVVIGGLLSSTVLTLVVIPTLYEWTNGERYKKANA